MSGLDYSTFSIRSALTPSQPTPARSHPADAIQEHAAEDVIDSHICNVQRDDLPSSAELSDPPREDPSMLSQSYHGQGSSSQTFVFPRPPIRSESADDIQGNILCAQLGEFHFTPQYGGHDHATVDEPTAIIENSSWGSQHSLHYPAPVRGFVSIIAEDARLGLTPTNSDVNARVRTRRPSMVITDQLFGRSYGFNLAASSSSLPSMGMDVTPFLPGGVITSPSPPPSAYHDDDLLGTDCAHPFTYTEQLPAMTTAHESAGHHYPIDCATAQSFGAFQDGAHQGIISLDHHYPTPMATPFPGYTSAQSTHPPPICETPSFGTAILAEELPRPGSAPPLIDSQVPFVGDARAALQSSQHTPSSEHANRQPTWYPQPVAPGTGQSPRSSPRRAGSIGHNSQKTPPGSRHLRRWSSVTNPALRASPPFSPSFSPNVITFPHYPTPSTSENAPVASTSTSTNTPCFSNLSPSAESEGDEPPAYAVPHAAALDSEPVPASDLQQQQQQTQAPPMRNVIRCDGYRIDEESWSAALARPDKQLHVYECFWDLSKSPCGMWIEGDQSSVADHLALFHNFRGGEVGMRCLWRDCPKPNMKGTSIARHVVTHIGFRVRCPTCKHEFARVDACNRAHSRSGCLGVGQPMYGDLQRVLDARKVESLLRPSKKRRTDE